MPCNNCYLQSAQLLVYVHALVGKVQCLLRPSTNLHVVEECAELRNSVWLWGSTIQVYCTFHCTSSIFVAIYRVYYCITLYCM